MWKKSREKSPYFQAAMDFGYTLLAAVGLFGFGGWWLDEKYQSTPWFLLLGIGLGLAVGFSSLFRRMNLLEKRSRARKERLKPRGPKDPSP